MFDKENWVAPEGHADPVADPGLPHITAYDVTDPDPVPPISRLLYEPERVTAREDV